MSYLKVTALSLSLLTSACASYRNVEKAPEQAQLPALNYSELAQQNSVLQNQEPVARWWGELNDEVLTDLITRSLMVNHDLRIALETINESRALLRRARWDYLPSIGTEVSATRQQQGADFATTDQRISERYQNGFDVSWELDVFGRLRNQSRLSSAQLRASEADLRAVQISLAAEVASVYLNLLGLHNQMEITQRSVEVQERNFELVKGFAQVGRSSDFDLSRAQAQLALVQARLPSLEQNYLSAINRLSVLTVIDAAELKQMLAEKTQLPSVPASVAIGDAKALLQQRPDVVRAEQALIGSVAEYNVRVSDLYPRFSLSGSFGYMSSEWSRMGEDQTDTFSFSPRIRWAALDLGRVKSQIAAADARAQRQLAVFEKTVLVAMEETNNAIVRFNQQEQRRQMLHRAANASAKAADSASKIYERGKGALTDVLLAEQQRLDAAQQLVDSEVAILLSLVDIYKNIGGGWSLAENEIALAR